MMPKTAVVVVAALLLAGCQQATVRDEQSQYSRIPVGSRLVLNEALSIPAGQARVFLQGGEIKQKTRLNQYYPHCNFEVRDVSDGTLRIEPGGFFVSEVREGEEMVVSREGPLKRVGFFGDRDSQGMISRFVHYRLGADKQPMVMRLTCHGGFAEPHEAAYPSLSEIRKALGDRVTLHLAGMP